MKGSGLNIRLAEGAVSPTNSKASKFDSQALKGGNYERSFGG